MCTENVNVALFCNGQFKLSRASSKNTSGPVHILSNFEH